jgi:hypothetical protein
MLPTELCASLCGIQTRRQKGICGGDPPEKLRKKKAAAVFNTD